MLSACVIWTGQIDRPLSVLSVPTLSHQVAQHQQHRAVLETVTFMFERKAPPSSSKTAARCSHASRPSIDSIR